MRVRIVRIVSTHSRPKAAGKSKSSPSCSSLKFQHTAARRRLGLFERVFTAGQVVFQHTAARRRLVWQVEHVRRSSFVSTHSRPKAAGKTNYSSARASMFQHTAARRRLDPKCLSVYLNICFNTQPPEGGWHCHMVHK